ncbi:hypothetical protein PPL_03219 [Heterostelium album PN500]|uniref:Phospholipid scramblase n=1 Tax=Heterostelium pallidum (strain ATCC 26659 / Pp 5 / PN500) TaxID=670386 RepID=D3B497_HETP5|nr:hypothetical protein PPL_03219 [Heterostelium album PN500]EFA84145.1 hypothetical protein PPL_03219 [Heterostelium album PN500]|eukprot:XP_020436262.1 hypothetical protein PPL_03219 [Heterostelium album PN500]
MDPYLDVLNNFNTLIVKQRPRGKWWELLCGLEHENEYKKSDILIAREHTSNGCLLCCGKYRKFKMTIRTLEGHEILKIKRPYHCGRQGCCCCCCVESCHQEAEIFLGEASSMPGKYLGRIKERFSCCLPVLNVFDDTGNEVYRVIGQCCGCSNYSLSIRQGNGTSSGWGDDGDEVGEIEKKWSGWKKELFTDADNFFINFPPDSSSQQKALLLGALFLVDYLFFENQSERSLMSDQISNPKIRNATHLS